MVMADMLSGDPNSRRDKLIECDLPDKGGFYRYHVSGDAFRRYGLKVVCIKPETHSAQSSTSSAPVIIPGQ